MAKDQVRNILSYLRKGGSYEYGCSLFLAITPNKYLAARLMISDSLPNREILEYELTKYLHSQPNYWEDYVSGAFDTLDPDPGTSNKQPSNQFYFVPLAEKAHDSDVRTKILQSRKDLYRDRGHLHGRLHQAETPEQRYQIQKEMITVQKKINRFNSDLTKLDQGEPPENFIQATTTVDAYKSRESIHRSIRRYKQKLSKTKDPKQIEQYQKKIEEYNKKLAV